MNRKFTLKKRKENIRRTNKGVCSFDLDQINNFFDLSITSIDENLLLAKNLIKKKEKERACDILRYQIAALESSFDYFLHGVAKYGIISMYEERWPKTDKYKKLRVPLKSVHSCLRNDRSSSDWLLNYIDREYSSQTWLSYEHFKETLNTLNKKIKDNLLIDLYPRSKNKDIRLKNFINKLYSRRNKIVHQDDREHTNGQKNDISVKEVKNYEKQIVKIQKSICKTIKKIDAS